MAILKTHTTVHGVTLENAYLKIVRLFSDTDVTRVTVDVYASTSARYNNPVIETLNINFDSSLIASASGSTLFEKTYNALKANHTTFVGPNTQDV
jgi:murein tripeptide amidase MpaA